jgi:hypothetical protein
MLSDEKGQDVRNNLRRVFKGPLILLLLSLIYAVGVTAWDESTQTLATADGSDARGALIAAFGGALMSLLVLAALAVAALDCRVPQIRKQRGAGCRARQPRDASGRVDKSK